MGILSRYNSRVVLFLLILVVVGLYKVFSTRHDELVDFHKVYQKLNLGQKQVFINTATQSTIDGPFDNSAILNLCASRNWTEGLIAQCGTPQGGVSNVRNVFLNCVRYSIEAGAAFIVPQMITRSDTDLRAITTNKIVGLSHLFDLEHFITSLKESCPQMKIYNHRNDLYNIPSTAKALELIPQDLSREFVHETVLAHPSEWRETFDEWLQSQITPLFRNRPILVDLNSPLFQFPLSYDSTPFIENFGRILRSRPDATKLAATALFEISRKYTLRLNPEEGITRRAFMGAHLRTEVDANAAGWTGYDAQATIYINQAISANLTTIYVAAGTPDDITTFRKQASLRSVNVTTKYDLLSEGDLEELTGLTWDQQALVDYEILLRSSTFGGIAESSFAWNIALRRNKLIWRESEDYLNGQGGQTFEDGLSWLYGQPGRLTLCAYSMWP